MFSLTAFGLTVAAVYFISQNLFHKSGLEKGSKAVAIVEQKPVKDQINIPNRSVFGSSVDLEYIKTRIMSPAFLQQALCDGGIEISPLGENGTHNASIVFLEQLRQGLSIRSKPGGGSGENHIILELSLTQSSDAPRIARALADRFVHEYRTFWAAKVQDAYLTVLAQADQAQQAHRDAVEKLQSFKDNADKQGQLTEVGHPLRSPTPELETPQIADNPAWVKLDRKLTSLRQLETALLANKTPLHPDILDIRGRIADCEQQMASTPRFTDESATDSSAQRIAPSSLVKTPYFQNEKENKDRISRDDLFATDNQSGTTETLKQLQDAVDLTELEYLKILHCEQQIFKASHEEPIFLVRVSPMAIAMTGPKSNRGLIELMLCSGFAMAVGISVFSSGVTTQPVLATIADLEPLLPVPIIGVVPGKDQSFDPIARRRRRTILRWLSILSGGLIILGCMGGVYWFFVFLG
jgi:hypothetical protein